MKPTLLLIDDDNEFLNDFTFLLKADYKTEIAQNSEKAMQKIQEIHPDLILLDLMLGDESGIEVLKSIKNVDPNLPVIMITEHTSIDTAVEAMKIGAENYVSKNLNIKELNALVEKVLKSRIERAKSNALMEEVNKPYSKIIGTSLAIQEVKRRINLASENDFTVLISGESGTGKELTARQIHNRSKRKNEIFVPVNCGALPENLIESELFGYEKGAFTGAVKRKLGKFEIASSGTIFLDEVSELAVESQVKLMRVLQDKEFSRLGGNETIKTNARIIAATNKNLKELMLHGNFREDLFYRLEVFPISIPTLRERKEDIPELIGYLLLAISAELNMPVPVISNKVIKQFVNYNWPGNVRELNNVLTRLAILSGGEKIEETLVERDLAVRQNQIDINWEILELKWTELNNLKKDASAAANREVEIEFVKRLLLKFNGNITKAAKYTGINRSNLHRMIKKIDLK